MSNDGVLRLPSRRPLVLLLPPLPLNRGAPITQRSLPELCEGISTTERFDSKEMLVCHCANHLCGLPELSRYARSGGLKQPEGERPSYPLVPTCTYLGIAVPDMPLMQVVTLSALVTAKSAFAYPHSQSALYKRGVQPLSAIGVVVVGIIGALVGVGTCTELATTRGSFFKRNHSFCSPTGVPCHARAIVVP